MNTEIHLIVLWSTARYKENEILDDIRKSSLKIRRMYEITWSEELVAANYTSFYGVHLPDKSHKERECGKGPFLCLVVEDAAPKYEYLVTSRGHERVNVNIFTCKKKYRSWTGGGHKIHTTNSPAETNHDSALMLGLNYEDLKRELAESDNAELVQLNRNITGVAGWKDFKELFYTLNSTADYIVMRGMNSLEEADISDLHGDIDILTTDSKSIAYILNVPPQINTRRPHYHTLIGNQRIWLDLWNVKDCYYDEKWIREMFASRVNNQGFWELDAENAFYLHLYHTFIHKRAIAPDYYAKAEKLWNLLPDKPALNFDRYYKRYDAWWDALKSWMKSHGYAFVRPMDESVFFNKRLLKCEACCQYLESEYQMHGVEPISINAYGGGGYIYMRGYYGTRKLFIKWYGIGESVVREYEMGTKLFRCSPEHFVEPVFYKRDGDKRFVASEFIEGDLLENLLKDNKLDEPQRINIAQQLVEISDVLMETRLVHRDVRPANLMLDKDGKLKLIDYQFVVCCDNYIENRWIITHDPSRLKPLGNVYAQSSYIWDDQWSIHKVMKELVGDKCVELLQKVEARIGKMKLHFFDALLSSGAPAKLCNEAMFCAQRAWLLSNASENEVYELDRAWFKKRGPKAPPYQSKRDWIVKNGTDEELYALDYNWLVRQGKTDDAYQLRASWLQKKGTLKELTKYEKQAEPHRKTYLRIRYWFHLRRRRLRGCRQLVLRIGRKEYTVSRVNKWSR